VIAQKIKASHANIVRAVGAALAAIAPSAFLVGSRFGGRLVGIEEE
jgi:hypothetical protein